MFLVCSCCLQQGVVWYMSTYSHTIFLKQFPVNVIRKCNLQETGYLTTENIVDH
jgi:hypothetical protein